MRVFFRGISVLLWLTAGPAPAQVEDERDIERHDSVAFSIITISPCDGVDFGSSAIRVKNFTKKFDFVVMYEPAIGKTNGFEKFSKGRLYTLKDWPFEQFSSYYADNRCGFTEQQLDLDTQQRRRFNLYMWWNHQPQNSGFYFNLFQNNATARVKTAIVKTIGEELKFEKGFTDTTGAANLELHKFLTAHRYYWNAFYFSFLSGMDARQEVVVSSFLPSHFRASLDKAFNKATQRPLVNSKTDSAITEAGPTVGAVLYFGLITALILATGIISFRGFETKPGVQFFDRIFFSALGIAGVVLLVIGVNFRMALFNANFFWAAPIHIVVPFIARHRFFKYYLYITLSFALAFISYLIFTTAPIDLLIVSVSSMAAVRCVALLRQRTK